MINAVENHRVKKNLISAGFIIEISWCSVCRGVFPLVLNISSNSSFLSCGENLYKKNSMENKRYFEKCFSGFVHAIQVNGVQCLVTNVL